MISTTSTWVIVASHALGLALGVTLLRLISAEHRAAGPLRPGNEFSPRGWPIWHR